MVHQVPSKIPVVDDAHIAQLQSELFNEASADSNRTFRVSEMLCSPALLRFAAKWAAQAKGDSTPGADGVVLRRMHEAALAKLLDDLVTDIDSERYVPSAANTVSSSNRNGVPATRTVLTARDRILQEGLSLLMYPLVEAELGESSYGGRPGIEPRDALLDIAMAIRSVSGPCFLIRTSIMRCFENISHQCLQDVISHRVQDRKVSLAIAKQLLKWCSRPAHGLPRDLPLSPLMVNWLLASVDRLFESKKDAMYFRHMDDFVIVVPGTTTHAQACLGALESALSHIELSLDSAKTRMVDAAVGVEFLGVHIRRGKVGHAEVQIASERFEQIICEMDYILNLPLDTNTMRERLQAATTRWVQYFFQFSPAMTARASKALQRRIDVALSHRIAPANASKRSEARLVPQVASTTFVPFGGKDIPERNKIAQSARIAAGALAALNPKSKSDEDLYLTREQTQNCLRGWRSTLSVAQQQFREFKIQRRQMNESAKSHLASSVSIEPPTVAAYLLETVESHEVTLELEQALRSWLLFWPPLISTAQGAIEAIDEEVQRRRVSAESVPLAGCRAHGVQYSTQVG